MILNDNFRTLSDEEASKYKFDFCERCEFYECELVREYAQFCESRQIHNNSQASQSCAHAVAVPLNDNENTENLVEATAVWVGHNDHIKNRASSDVELNSETGRCLTYDQEELKDGCIMNGRNIQQIECGRKRVSEGIGDHYKIEIRKDSSIETGSVNRWEPKQPVFISAQTGQGKNYFIENDLIPYVRELNYKNVTRQKVLILSNRLALKCQIQNRLNGNEDSDNEDGKIYPYKDVADVMTYQSLLPKRGHLKRVQARAHERYIYVICDEAHFFTSDAMFNPYTYKILSTIISLFQNSIRVYMSATPYDCLKYIINQEKSNPMAFYHFKRDYSYLDIKPYSSMDELYDQIIKSVNVKKEKWLIFIDDRDKCATLKTKLEKIAEEKKSPLIAEDKQSKKIEKVFAVNASSKKNPSYMAIVEKEALDKDTYVLISTSVLDNGVNLAGIKNIVVSDMAKVKCLQMVGRARGVGGNDRKTLYIKRFCSDEIDRYIKNFMSQEDAYHSYELAYGEPRDPLQSRGYSEYKFLDKYYNGDNKDWENAKHWFGRPYDTPTKLYLNEIAKSLLDKFVPQYQAIYDEIAEEEADDGMRSHGKKPYIGQKYLEYQLSWFGKTYCIDDDVTFADKEKLKKAFIAFLKSYADGEQQINKEMQKDFRAEFTRMYDVTFGRKERNKERIYDITRINTYLEDENISYRVKSHSAYWVVDEYD